MASHDRAGNRMEAGMRNRQYTKAELGLVSGTLVGASIGVLLMALTGDAIWLTVTGVGIALGYGIGATMDAGDR